MAIIIVNVQLGMNEHRLPSCGQNSPSTISGHIMKGRNKKLTKTQTERQIIIVLTLGPAHAGHHTIGHRLRSENCLQIKLSYAANNCVIER